MIERASWLNIRGSLPKTLLSKPKLWGAASLVQRAGKLMSVLLSFDFESHSFSSVRLKSSSV